MCHRIAVSITLLLDGCVDELKWAASDGFWSSCRRVRSGHSSAADVVVSSYEQNDTPGVDVR